VLVSAASEHDLAVGTWISKSGPGAAAGKPEKKRGRRASHQGADVDVEPVQLGVGQLHRGHRLHERRDYYAVHLMLQIDRFAGSASRSHLAGWLANSSATVAAIFVSCPRPIIGVSGFRCCSKHQRLPLLQ
jgi:hypothetical protein